MPCESRRMGECLELCLGAKKSWLQRSQMFIEPLLTVSLALRRSAMFSAMIAQVEQVSLLWSEEGSFGSCFYKHFVPTGRGR
jgi:hypothetical protein